MKISAHNPLRPLAHALLPKPDRTWRESIRIRFSGANIHAGPQGRAAWDCDRRLFLVLFDVVLDRRIQPEYRGDLSPHDQGPRPACQFGDLDGAGRTHRRRWAADRFGAPRTFAAILAGCGLV